MLLCDFVLRLRVCAEVGQLRSLEVLVLLIVPLWVEFALLMVQMHLWPVEGCKGTDVNFPELRKGLGSCTPSGFHLSEDLLHHCD